jgi:hypothetical protein
LSGRMFRLTLVLNQVRHSRLTNPMIKHLPQGPSHARPPRLLPIDSVHGLVQEETDSPSVPGRCVDDASGCAYRTEFMLGQGGSRSGLVDSRGQGGCAKGMSEQTCVSPGSSVVYPFRNKQIRVRHENRNIGQTSYSMSHQPDYLRRL